MNVQAVMQMTWLLLPGLRRRRKATIINVASLAAFYPMPSMAVYAATVIGGRWNKAAVKDGCGSLTPVIESTE